MEARILIADQRDEGIAPFIAQSSPRPALPESLRKMPVGNLENRKRRPTFCQNT